MGKLLTDFPWLGGFAWAVAYLLDWILTIAGARSYDRLAGRFISIEQLVLNPILQGPVEQRRFGSPRFWLLWLVSTALVGIDVWMLVSWGMLNTASFVVGALLILGAVVLTRHGRNLLAFRLLREVGGADGFIRYREWYSQRTSAHEAGLIGALFVTLAALEQSWFLLGGGCGCMLLALRAWLRSTRLQRSEHQNPSGDGNSTQGHDDPATGC